MNKEVVYTCPLGYEIDYFNQLDKSNLQIHLKETKFCNEGKWYISIINNNLSFYLCAGNYNKVLSTITTYANIDIDLGTEEILDIHIANINRSKEESVEVIKNNYINKENIKECSIIELKYLNKILKDNNYKQLNKYDFRTIINSKI